MVEKNNFWNELPFGVIEWLTCMPKLLKVKLCCLLSSIDFLESSFGRLKREKEVTKTTRSSEPS